MAFTVLDSPPPAGTWLQSGMFGLRVRYVDLLGVLKAKGHPRERMRSADQVNGYVVHVTAGFSPLQNFVSSVVNLWVAHDKDPKNVPAGTMPVCVNCFDDADGFVQLLPLETVGIATTAAEPFVMSVETVNKGDANLDTWNLRQKLDHARAFAQGVQRGWWPHRVMQTSTPDFARGGLGFHTMRGDSSSSPKAKCANGTSDMTTFCGKSCPGHFHRGYKEDRKLHPWRADGSDLLGTMKFIFDTAGQLLDGQSPREQQTEDDDMPRLSPPLIQGSGKDGSFAGAVYMTDGQLITYRWIPNPKTLEEVRVKLRAAGLSEQIEGVDNLAAFGVLVGPTPKGR